MTIINHKPSVAFLNPPYDVGTAGQLEFIEHALNALDEDKDGRVIAIVQMSCATKNETDLIAVKERFLTKHHLRAVISMPDDLFYPVGVVTCIMVFDANKSNIGRKTWFGYFKDDGFIKRKHIGRIDGLNLYTARKEILLQVYRNLDEIPEFSVRHEVSATDEWCAEAYLRTDYSNVGEKIFNEKIRDFAAHKIASMVVPVSSSFLDTRKWYWFRYDDIFFIKKGFYNKKPDEVPDGDIPFIGAADSNNGITSMCDLPTIEATSKTGDDNNASLSEKLFESNCITVSNNGSIGYAFYQDRQFTCTHDVNALYLKNYMLNKYIAMFLCAIIEKDRYRWTYGRKWRPARMPSSLIMLPVKNDGTPDWQFMENYIKSLHFSVDI